MLYQKIQFEYIFFLLLNYNENNFNILYKFPVKVEIFLSRNALGRISTLTHLKARTVISYE